jgi:hypothetical protein
VQIDELLTLWAIRTSFGAYAFALAMLLAGQRSSLARSLWTAGYVAYLIHLTCAFGFYHHWSHAAAYAHTARRTAELLGFVWGGGIYFNYIFTAVWLVDVAWWWVNPSSYGSRAPIIVRAIHGFLGFMFFQATAVFGAGTIRWVGVLAFAVLGILWIRMQISQRRADHVVSRHSN